MNKPVLIMYLYSFDEYQHILNLGKVTLLSSGVIGVSLYDQIIVQYKMNFDIYYVYFKILEKYMHIEYTLLNSFKKAKTAFTAGFHVPLRNTVVPLIRPPSPKATQHSIRCALTVGPRAKVPPLERPPALYGHLSPAEVVAFPGKLWVHQWVDAAVYQPLQNLERDAEQ